MRKSTYGYRTVLILMVGILLAACNGAKTLFPESPAAHPDLAAHSKEFRREVVRVTDGVYVAVGFGLANSILLEGDDGVVIVDTMESEEAAMAVKEAFRAITPKPVKAIVYTHYHPDHDFGTTAFCEGKDMDIYAHASTLTYLDRIANVTRDTTFRRSMRQFGTLLPEGGVINCGIGPYLDFDQDSTLGLIRPNRTFSSETLSVTVAGLALELIHAPGETNDQIVIWLPQKKVLLAADNFYRSFPNLYAIRGTAYRDVRQWVTSLDKMRDLKPEFLVPSHTRPIIGADKIFTTLTDYRDAIQFVHDQTIRNINLGLTPDEIVEKVILPKHLADKPYLHEYYGTVAWSVRSIFTGYLGWFGGNATDLYPLAPARKAAHMAALAGGKEALLTKAKLAADNGEHQWALELADHLIRLNPDDPEPQRIRAAALTAIGGKQIASTARNYYLTQALEASGELAIDPRQVKESEVAIVHAIPLAAIFSGMAVRLDPQKSLDVDKVVGFRFPDTGEAYTLHVRHGVAEVQPRFPENPEIVVSVDAAVWKEIAAKIRNPALALMKGDISIQGGTLDLVSFLRLFDRS